MQVQLKRLEQLIRKSIHPSISGLGCSGSRLSRIVQLLLGDPKMGQMGFVFYLA